MQLHLVSHHTLGDAYIVLCIASAAKHDAPLVILVCTSCSPFNLPQVIRLLPELGLARDLLVFTLG